MVVWARMVTLQVPGGVMRSLPQTDLLLFLPGYCGDLGSDPLPPALTAGLSLPEASPGVLGSLVQWL